MILNLKLRKFAEETTEMLYNIYYEQLLNNEIPKDEYYSLVLNETVKFFEKNEEYEKCLELQKLNV
jgi:hypothetical protein